MRPYRYRDEDESSHSWLFIAAGAVVGLAAGLLVAQRFGGLSGVTSRLRESVGEGVGGRLRSRFRRAAETEEGEEDEEERADRRRRAAAETYDEDDYEDVSDEELEERVLEAFTNDPVLGERPIDIGAIGASTIELTGWVYAPDEADHAVTVAGGVPGVDSVVNRLEVRAETERLEDNKRRFEEGDDALREARWEGQGVGTGRRRQGNSSELDRHADPKVHLEDRWQSKEQALRAAADDIENIVGEPVRNPPQKAGKGDRTGGAPTAPSGVPKADHVADPTALPPDSLRAD